MAVYVEGLREITRGFERAGVDVEELKDVMGPIAAEAAAVLTPTLPRLSGALRASARPNRAKGKAVVMIGKARVPYAGPVIYGWPKRHIRSHYADTIGRTDAAMEDRVPELLAEGWNRIAERNGLA